MDPDVPLTDDDKTVEKQIADDQMLLDDLIPRHVDHRVNDVINNVNGYYNGDKNKYTHNDDDEEEGDMHEMDRHAVGHVELTDGPRGMNRSVAGHLPLPRHRCGACFCDVFFCDAFFEMRPWIPLPD